MKKIGREVLFLRTGANNPRNGEGTFARLKNGDILHVYTEYYGDSHRDDGTARLSAVISHDEGETWSAPYVLLEKDAEAENYMSPSLVRLPDGGLGMIYLRKSLSGIDGDVFTRIHCMPMFCRSEDEGQSWSEAVICGVAPGYYCAINDGACVTAAGRILSPMASHTAGEAAEVVIAYSDDCGAHWSVLPAIRTPYSETSVGLQEPGIYEHGDGELWMYCRTMYGHQYQSRSRDGGITWTTPAPLFCFTSPNAPMRVKKIGAYTLAIFNPTAPNCVRENPADVMRLRTPLVCAVSGDDGRSFDAAPGGRQMQNFAARTFTLEDDPRETYCYPSMIGTADGFLAAYYHSGGTGYTLAGTKMIKVRFEEIEA